MLEKFEKHAPKIIVISIILLFIINSINGSYTPETKTTSNRFYEAVLFIILFELILSILLYGYINLKKNKQKSNNNYYQIIGLERLIIYLTFLIIPTLCLKLFFANAETPAPYHLITLPLAIGFWIFIFIDLIKNYQLKNRKMILINSLFLIITPFINLFYIFLTLHIGTLY